MYLQAIRQLTLRHPVGDAQRNKACAKVGKRYGGQPAGTRIFIPLHIYLHLGVHKQDWIEFALDFILRKTLGIEGAFPYSEARTRLFKFLFRGHVFALSTNHDDPPFNEEDE